MSKCPFLLLLLFIGLLLTPLTVMAAAGDPCRQSLLAVEAASRSAQEALVVARARDEAPAMAEQMAALEQRTDAAAQACGQVKADSGAESGGWSGWLPDFSASSDDDAPKRRTPSERVHGQY